MNSCAIIKLPVQLHYYHSSVPQEDTPKPIAVMLNKLATTDTEIIVQADSEGRIIDIRMNHATLGYNYITTVCKTFAIEQAEALYVGRYSLDLVRTFGVDIIVVPLHTEEIA